MAKHRKWLAGDAAHGERAVFRYASLSHLDFSDEDLRRVDFSGARFIDATLRGANLERVSFADGILTGANLQDANLSGANFSFAKAKGIDLRGATLSGTIFSAADIGGAHVEGADLSGTRDINPVFMQPGIYFDAATRWPEAIATPVNLNSFRGKLNQGADRLINGLTNWAPLLIALLGVLVTIGSVVSGVHKEKQGLEEQQKKVKDQEDRVRSLAAEAPAANSPSQFTQAELALAIERERVSMQLADGRSNTLFTLSTILIVLSVFAPVASAFLYRAADPLALAERARAAGLAADLSTVALARDWHILVAGISFGFLFLAAAAAVLRQARHHTSTYFRLGRRVTDFESMISALKIVERMPEIPGQPTQSHLLVGQIVERLMQPTSPDSGADERTPEEASSDGGRIVNQIMSALGDGRHNML